MKGWIRRRVLRLALVTTALFAVAGGIAYATIPDAGKVYTACMLNSVGTVRLIDTSLPSTNPMSHCTSLETQITWNQLGQQGLQGDKGAPGANGKDGVNGPNGADGKDGVSVTSVSLSAGDSNCPAGGSKFTSASGTTYACNGATGGTGHAYFNSTPSTASILPAPQQPDMQTQPGTELSPGPGTYILSASLHVQDQSGYGVKCQFEKNGGNLAGQDNGFFTTFSGPTRTTLSLLAAASITAGDTISVACSAYKPSDVFILHSDVSAIPVGALN